MSDPCDCFEIVNNGLKCTTKALECAQALGHFLAPIIMEPAEMAAGIAYDFLRQFRWELQQKYIQRVEKIIGERGLTSPTRRVPLNIAIPLLQAASMEEDDLLREMWARLLVNAMDADRNVEMRRAFIDILESLTSLDAQILEKISSACGDDAQEGVNSEEIAAQLVSEGILQEDEVIDAAADADSAKAKRRNDAFAISLLNLQRLGCIRDEAYLGSNDGGVTIPNITPLGAALIAACAE